MNIHQAQWAESHDWFRHAVNYGSNTWAVYVYDDYLQQILPFHDYKALRAWAGY